VFMLLNTAPIEVLDRPAEEIVMGSAEAIGAALYSEWLFPFEAISILLLVAMIGAVVMTGHAGKKKSA
jgi:NADH-quinone oxidoreductase subunit J